MNARLTAKGSKLSLDQYSLLVFIARCAWFIAVCQIFLPRKYLPADERVPLRLLWKLRKACRGLIPRGTTSSRKLPRQAAKLASEFFEAVVVIRLSRGELWRAGEKEFVGTVDEVYAALLAIGEKLLRKKRQSKKV